MAQKNRDKFDRKAATWPKDPQALKRLERHIEFGELGDLPLSFVGFPMCVTTHQMFPTGSFTPP